MLKKIAKLGLAGLLCANLAGCATFHSYETERETHEVKEYKEERVVNINKERISTLLEYKIEPTDENPDELGIHVTETRKDLKKVTTTTATPVYRQEKESTFKKTTLWFLLWTGELSTDLEGSRVLSKTKVRDETNKKESNVYEVAYENQPAKDALVKASSQYFGLGENKDSSILTKTDAKGIARIKITKMPYLFYFDENKAKKDVLPILKRGMKTALFNKINLNNISLGIINKEYPVTVKTVSEANLLLTEENLKIKDDEKTFKIAGKEMDISSLYSYISNIIKTDLESEYMPRTVVIRAVGEDLIQINASIEFKAVKTLPLEELLNETERIKGNYLVKGEELYERINVNPSYLLYNLDGKKATIPVEGLPIVVNVPSEYDIRVIKEGYAPFKEKIVFTEKSLPVLEMGMEQLGTRVNLDKAKSSGRWRSQ